jgi:8-oxo-dGTP pyrophosphatase MutT (NUDIX family)
VHREAVLALLTRHSERDLDPHESEMTQETIRFVREHENCLLRTQLAGHLTGSAWVVNPSRQKTLLTHHRKLDKWLQLGGHADGDPDLKNVALREAVEESGLTNLRVVTKELFDVDRHLIPARKDEPEHWHFDLRFMIEADPSEPLLVTNESKALAWVDIDQVTSLNPEESMARMVRKTIGSS